MNFEDTERQAYEEHLKWLRVEASTLKKYQRQSFAEGKEEGKAEGRAESKEEKAIEVAREMLLAGIDVVQAVNFVKLSLEQVKLIENEIKSEVAS